MSSIQLQSTNENGVMERIVVKKGKYKEVPRLENCKLYHHGIGKVISEDITPKFQGWTYEDYALETHKTGFTRFLEPMSAFEDPEYMNHTYNNEVEIAELKMDGHRGLLYIGDKYNRAFSRTISKKTGWYTENSDNIPHIRDLSLPEYAGTVLDGEFDYGKTSMQVQSVMGSLPERAIQFQYENGWIDYFAFDILYYKGINIQSMPLWKRKVYLMEVLNAFWGKYANCSMNFTKIYTHSEAFTNLSEHWEGYASQKVFDDLIWNTKSVLNYQDKFLEKVAEGLEGLVVKDMYSPYEQKRSKSFIKLKGAETWDVIMIGLTEPTKVYDGKELKTWKYWETPEGKLVQDDRVTEGFMLVSGGYTPVTKPYFMGWCGGIQFGVLQKVPDSDLDDILDQALDDQIIDEGGQWVGEDLYMLVHVGDCKGLNEKTMEDLKKNGDKYVRERRVFEVLANGIIDKEKGSLRHPRFARWHDAKSAEMCDFKSHIREVD